jgi:hypothetical protein
VARIRSCQLHYAASLTQAIEIVATEIAARFDYMPWEFQLMEHYDWRGTRCGTGMGDYTEHFHLVDFQWNERNQELHTPHSFVQPDSPEGSSHFTNQTEQV